MERDCFLRHVGDPADMVDESSRLDAEAQALWDTIRDVYFTKAGKPRAKQPEPWSDHARTRGRVDALRSRASELRVQAARTRRLHDDPWSHIRPDILRSVGIDRLADAVEVERVRLQEHGDMDRFIREAEAA